MPLRNWAGLLILCLVTYMPIFAHLGDQLPLMLWDESRLANNAIEMYDTGNLVVVTYDYAPEMWSTKPPFLIWMQTLSFNLFGISDLSFRLPTAIAALLTCLFIYFFSRRELNAPWLGIIASIVLVCSPGYIREHGTRTGDYDSMLTLFTTISLLYFYSFIENGGKRQFWLSVAALILGCLTKGVAGLMFLPAMVLYAIYKRKFASILKSKELYLAMGAFAVFVIGYYLLRERYNHGYISAVWENEIGGRYNEAKEGHGQPPGFYFRSLYLFAFKPFLPFLLLGIILIFTDKYKSFRNVGLYLLLCSLSYLIVITGSATKHSWYIMPALPLFSIIAAIPIYSACRILCHFPGLKWRFGQQILPYVFLVLICIGPFVEIVKYATTPIREEGWLQGPNDAGIIIQKMLVEGYPHEHRMKVVFEDLQSPLQWYMKACRLKNIPVTQLKDERELTANDLLMVYNDSVKAHMEIHYDTHVVEQRGKATIYQVHGMTR
ncbi:MAG TPA: glycosyltransferase family 39 protein [Flavipsychrobacter sp.]|nr:glycosyltransferase family 39 protein [Flavipsychrobacter sp.]